MHRLIFLFFTLQAVFGVTVYSQNGEKSVNPSEISFNAFDFIALGGINLMYEKYQNESLSIGGDVFARVSDEGIDRKFSSTFFLRQYFGKEQGKGFFLEYFSGFVVKEDPYVYYDWCYECGPINPPERGDQKGFSLGLGIGNKLLAKQNFVASIYLGVGRIIFNPNVYEPLYARFGVNIGLRKTPKSQENNLEL